MLRDEGVATCEPWPETGHLDCTEPDEAHFAGEPGCARIGSECPAGDLPEGLPTSGPVVYVSAAAAPGGDGSIGAPFQTIDDAASLAGLGWIVAVGKGTYDEAVTLVNENPYGNGAAIFTRDGGAARQFQFECNAGMVGVNVPIPVPVAYYSFGGWKASLFGDSHAYGPESIHFYTRGKVVTSRWPDPATSKVDLGFPQTR